MLARFLRLHVAPAVTQVDPHAPAWLDIPCEQPFRELMVLALYETVELKCTASGATDDASRPEGETI